LNRKSGGEAKLKKWDKNSTIFLSDFVEKKRKEKGKLFFVCFRKYKGWQVKISQEVRKHFV
jgi:hypothetical protein